jgi:hypothetical protein
VIGQNNPEAIKVLAAAHADLNVRDRTGTPAITEAAMILHWNCVWTLIELGADWKADDKGVTVPYLAYTCPFHADSPMYPWLQKAIAYFKKQGVAWPPAGPPKRKGVPS